MLKRTTIFLIAVVALVFTLALYSLFRPIVSDEQKRIEFVVNEGETSNQIISELAEKDVSVSVFMFKLVARISGLDTKLKTGGYELLPGDSTWTLLSKLRRSEFTQARVRLIEGWTVKQIRKALAKNPYLTHTLQGVSDAQLAELLGIDAPYLEAMFFPDTYTVPKGTKDIDVLKEAHTLLQERLDEVWEKRADHSQVRTPYELLTLASIVEKETGRHSDRGRIAGVFNNRLKINMPLQTDPTVIYGLGDGYSGRLRKVHLRDSSNRWNTYKIPALPPSPIAAVGMQSLEAAANPERHTYLYFVATGDGGSAFASNLDDHNKNVNRYIRGKK